MDCSKYKPAVLKAFLEDLAMEPFHAEIREALKPKPQVFVPDEGKTSWKPGKGNLVATTYTKGYVKIAPETNARPSILYRAECMELIEHLQEMIESGRIRDYGATAAS